jgi:hypothetical protein
VLVAYAILTNFSHYALIILQVKSGGSGKTMRLKKVNLSLTKEKSYALRIVHIHPLKYSVQQIYPKSAYILPPLTISSFLGLV